MQAADRRRPGAGRAQPAALRLRVRARRRADRRRRRALPRGRLDGDAGRVRAAGARGAGLGSRRRAPGWSGCGSPSASASWARGRSPSGREPAATPGWSRARRADYTACPAAPATWAHGPTALRALQKPIKDRYREDPRRPSSRCGPAVASRATRSPCTVDTWAGPVRAGLHPSAAGDGSDACSGDMLLQARRRLRRRDPAQRRHGDGCRAARRARRRGGNLRRPRHARRRQEHPGRAHGRGRAVRLRHRRGRRDASSGCSSSTEKYCVVAQTLSRPPSLSVGRI